MTAGTPLASLHTWALDDPFAVAGTIAGTVLLAFLIRWLVRRIIGRAVGVSVEGFGNRFDMMRSP